MRFLGFPETTGTEEVASEVVYKFLEKELELDGARGIEFQRVHRIGRKKTGACRCTARPIIARFLRFPDRERIFRRALEVRDDTEVRVFTDLPREIQERRKKQWPKLKKVREEGKLASLDKKLRNPISYILMDILFLCSVMQCHAKSYLRVKNYRRF